MLAFHPQLTIISHEEIRNVHALLVQIDQFLQWGELLGLGRRHEGLVGENRLIVGQLQLLKRGRDRNESDADRAGSRATFAAPRRTFKAQK